MWCGIFHLFVRWNKNRKTVMKGNFRLNINIDGHIADLHCLFRYFKNIWPFLLTLISLNKDIFLPFCCRKEKKLVFSEKVLLFTDDIVLLASWSFMISLWIILSRNCNVIFEFNNYEYKSTCSLGMQSFRPTIFRIHLHLWKEHF